MKKEVKLEPPRLFKVSHQLLCLTGINFENQSLLGYTELTIWPLKTGLTSLRINSKQCSIYKVSIDKKHEVEFTYFDPMLDVCQGNAVKRNIDYFHRCQNNALTSVDPERGNGEIIVTLPQDVLSAVSAQSSIQLCVEFGLQSPQCGLYFVLPDLPGTLAQRSAHMYTWVTENSSRLWFPCVDTFSEPCTWKLEVTVDKDMTAVVSGDLVAVDLSEDLTQKTYHYFLSSPTAAPNVALAVGPFELLVDPKMHEVTHFCLPKLMPILKHTTSYIHQSFEFYEELMSSRYPYSSYKQVFVDMSYHEVATYATMSILSTNLLHPPNIIDQTMASRQLMATAVAQQFFGSFIGMQSWGDAWLTKGITGYLSYMFCKRTFGNNEYRNWVMRDMQEVSEYEQKVGFVILDSSRRESNHTFSTRSPHTLSPRYVDMFAKKARLVMRMLEIRIGTELFLQVLNKLLSLAYNASQQAFALGAWSNMLLSTSSFLKIIYTVTGKDIEPFIDQWVYQGGVARFSGNFVFNRKRNVVELEIKQDLNALGALKFVGALNVTIQELDGSFNHTFKIEENKTKFEITCHSKSRRNKKKKIPLMTGEEADMDLSAMDQESPVLWLRLDPDMHLLRTVHFEQPDYMWQYQLKFERCIVAQFEAIEALSRFSTPASRYALTDTIENNECYYRVRQDACYCLAKIANLMMGSWTGPPAMITIFRKMFGSHSCPFILRQNNFSNFHHYYLLKTMPQAMSRLRDSQSLCLPDVIKFLLDLFKYNDNSRNKWSDNYFRAAIVEALAASITPAITNVSLITGQVATSESLSGDMRQFVEEVVRALNLEKLMPCYRYTVTCSCLYTIRTLQKNGHLPNDSDVFKDYVQPGIFRDVRVAAITCLVDFIRGDITGEHLYWVLDLIEKDQDPYLRHHAVTCLIQNPPFRMSERSALNVEHLVEHLWNLMSSTLSLDSRLRCGLADLYFTLYGRQRPTCLPVPETVKQALKEKKAKEESLASDGPAQTQSSQDSGFESQPRAPMAEWNPELSSMFEEVQTETSQATSPAAAASTGTDPAMEGIKDIGDVDKNPSTVTVNLDMDAEITESNEMEVDLTMISGEQTVAMEESVITETEDLKQDTETKSSQEAEMSPLVPDRPSVTPPLCEEDRPSSPPPPSGGDGVSHLSEGSISPPHDTEPPEDVVISLDNIIRSQPTSDMFTSPLSSPKPPSLKEEDKDLEPPPLSESLPPVITSEHSASPSPPFQTLSAGQGSSLSRSSSQASVHLEVKEPPPEEKPPELIPVKEEVVAIETESQAHPSPPPPTVRFSSPTVRSSPPIEKSSPPNIKSSPPTIEFSPPPPPLKTSPPTSPPPIESIQPSSPPPPTNPTSPSAGEEVKPEMKTEPEEEKEEPPPPPPPPTIVSLTASSFPSSPLKLTLSTARLTDQGQTTTGYPSLKTTIFTGASGSSEVRTSSSHHKAKKKKKKNKHKHKHKHKHDRADRDQGQTSREDRPRERLVLAMGELSRSANSAEKQDESSSDMEI